MLIAILAFAALLAFLTLATMIVCRHASPLITWRRDPRESVVEIAAFKLSDQLTNGMWYLDMVLAGESGELTLAQQEYLANVKQSIADAEKHFRVLADQVRYNPTILRRSMMRYERSQKPKPKGR